MAASNQRGTPRSTGSFEQFTPEAGSSLFGIPRPPVNEVLPHFAGNSLHLSVAASKGPSYHPAPIWVFWRLSSYLKPVHTTAVAPHVIIISRLPEFMAAFPLE